MSNNLTALPYPKTRRKWQFSRTVWMEISRKTPMWTPHKEVGWWSDGESWENGHRRSGIGKMSSPAPTNTTELRHCMFEPVCLAQRAPQKCCNVTGLSYWEKWQFVCRMYIIYLSGVFIWFPSFCSIFFFFMIPSNHKNGSTAHEGALSHRV